MCMRLVLLLTGHILNQIFKMKYETHAYGNEFKMENIFKKWNEKNKNSFWKLVLKWNKI